MAQTLQVTVQIEPVGEVVLEVIILEGHLTLRSGGALVPAHMWDACVAAIEFARRMAEWTAFSDEEGE